MPEKQDSGPNASKKKGQKEEEDMSEEDIAIKDAMELMVTRIGDPDIEIRKSALLSMVKEVREATASMTSVPKPLKFLRPHYQTMQKTFIDASDSDPTKPMLADVLSLLVSHDSWYCIHNGSREAFASLSKWSTTGKPVGYLDHQADCFCSTMPQAMTMSDEKRASLKYRLLGMQEDVGSWGHEYVRHLAGERRGCVCVRVAGAQPHTHC